MENNSNNQDDIYRAVVTLLALWEFTGFIWWK